MGLSDFFRDMNTELHLGFTGGAPTGATPEAQVDRFIGRINEAVSTGLITRNQAQAKLQEKLTTP